MKLIDRTKFITIGSSAWADSPSQNRNNYPGRIYKCTSNLSKMTMFERLWLTPELYLFFGNYHKSNIWWFLFTFFFPFMDDLYDIFKKNYFWNLSMAEGLAVIGAILIMLCGLGWIWSVLRARYDIKQGRKEMKMMSMGTTDEC